MDKLEELLFHDFEERDIRLDPLYPEYASAALKSGRTCHILDSTLDPAQQEQLNNYEAVKNATCAVEVKMAFTAGLRWGIALAKKVYSRSIKNPM